jgi:hypothetical protein
MFASLIYSHLYRTYTGRLFLYNGRRAIINDLNDVAYTSFHVSVYAGISITRQNQSAAERMVIYKERKKKNEGKKNRHHVTVVCSS